MKYISTRGNAPELGFEDVLLAGLATDGGLYVPDHWPTIDEAEWRSLRGKPYEDVAMRVMQPFVNGEISDTDLRQIIDTAYSRFRHRSIAPLIQIGDNQFVCELFHGPTLAFKDVAMQVLGLLYDHVLAKRDTHITIVGATSGDTGSAAIEAIRGRDRASIFIMHPHNRTSEVQRRQMTTVDEPNVHNIAIEGTFDDCQNLLKAMFNDLDYRNQIKLSGVNSINWCRVLPQVVYYCTTALALGAPDREINFSVPTGNFGDIFAGYVAKQMGLPIGKLVIASNANDILTRVMNTGDHQLGEVHPTLSPSMDIQISSNFERLMFDLYDRDAATVDGLMKQLKAEGRFQLSDAARDKALANFAAHCVDDARTLEVIRETHQQCGGYIVDPHTAIGVDAAYLEHGDGQTPMVTLATAHPAKFPDAVDKAIGHRPALPEHLADLYERDEKFDTLPNDLATVMNYIAQRSALPTG